MLEKMVLGENCMLLLPGVTIFFSSDLAQSWLLIRPAWSSKCQVHFCFSDTDDEDQSTEGLDGLLRTHTSNYTRFFEEMRKYGCNVIYLNGMKVTNRKRQ
jgi:hypothetical protein